MSEEVRKAAETARKSAERARLAAEVAREAADESRRALDEARRISEMLRRKSEQERVASEQTRRADEARFDQAVRQAVREQSEVSAEMRLAAQAFGANPVVGQAGEARAGGPRARRKRS